MILGGAGGAVHLDRLVDHARAARCAPKNLMSEISSRAASLPCGVDLPGRVERHQPRGMDVRARLGDPVLDVRLARERRAEHLALGGVATHQLEGALGHAEPAHAVMDPPGAEALLRDREPRSLLAETIGDRARGSPRSESRRDGCRRRPSPGCPRSIVKPGVSVGTMIWLKRRCGSGCCGIVLRHDDRERRAVRTAREPLVTVDDVVIAVANRGGAEPARIGARDLRLRHREAAADIARDQRLEPALPSAPACRSARESPRSPSPAPGSPRKPARTGSCRGSR